MKTRANILAPFAVLPTLILAVLFVNRLAPGVSAAAQAGGNSPGTGTELLQNGGFEDSTETMAGWSRDMAHTGKEGVAARDPSSAHSGAASMKLSPNDRNGGDQPLAISQIITGNLGGRHLVISGYVLTQGSAVAHIGALTIAHGKPGHLTMLTAKDAGQWTLLRGDYDIAQDFDTKVVFICWVDGKSGAAWFDDLSLKTADRAETEGNAPASSPSAMKQADGRIEVDATRIIRTIPDTLYGANMEWIWNGNGAWLPEKNEPDQQILKLTRELGVKLIRYPGGVYSDFYHWKDGVGPAAKRPEVKHLPNKDERSHINFGTDEALRFSQLTGGELLITVNAGTGTAQEAADWVRYVNVPRQRVKYWEIGNELYLNDRDLGPKAVTIKPELYAQRVIEFARAMRAVDPSIKVLAIGGENHGRYTTIAYPDWNRVILTKAGSEIDYLSVHNAYAPLVTSDSQEIRTVYRAMLAAPQLIEENFSTIQNDIQTYAPRRASSIGIAVTEWGPAFRFDLSSRYLDHGKTLASALFAAGALQTFLRNPRVQIANFWELNDYSVLGWIGTRDTSFPLHPDWTPTAKYYAFQMFTQHFGTKLVEADQAGPTFSSEAVGLTDAASGVSDLSTVASLNDDGSKLYVITVNRSLDTDIRASFDVKGFRPRPAVEIYVLNGRSIDANTGTGVVKVPGLRLPDQAQDGSSGRFAHGGPGEIAVKNEQQKWTPKMQIVFPAHSVTALVFSSSGR